VTSDKETFNSEVVQENSEFEQVVKIEKIEQPPGHNRVREGGLQKSATKKKSASQAVEAKKSSQESHMKTSQRVKKQSSRAPKPRKAKPQQQAEVKKPTVVKKQATPAAPRQPRIEDDEGFSGRRPVVQPFDVGEEVVLGLSYFGVEAGKFTMQVRPMVQVNGKKSYHFRYLIKSSPVFSMFYSVDDVAETFVDYQNLLPYSYEIHVNESKQIRETRTFFDHNQLKAVMWDSKQRKNQKVEQKKVKWDLQPFSQNVFSAAYYLRNFTLRVGKELKVRVGHEGKNIEMTAKVIRRETIFTDVGKFDTFVVKPKFDIDGKFKPTGENYLWLTADDKKFIVRLESKIKIGSIVGEVQKLKP
jgi:hypothetical protein